MNFGLFQHGCRRAAIACLLLPAVAAAQSTASPEALRTLEREIARLEQDYAARHAALEAEIVQIAAQNSDMLGAQASLDPQRGVSSRRLPAREPDG